MAEEHTNENPQLPQTAANLAAGLSDSQAEQRLLEVGPNELVEQGQRAWWRILVEQFTSAMVFILIVAAIVSAAVGGATDTVVILIIVALNTALGFTQEFRAERAMAALKRLTVPTVRVRRGGRTLEIPARDLVPGDLTLIEAGNVIPADGRLVNTAGLIVQESALTGESHAVEKDAQFVSEPDAPVGDRRERVFLGTIVTGGHGEFTATETGMRTELGRIATMIQKTGSEQTPLQRRLDRLGKSLALIALGIVSLIFSLGVLRGEELEVMFFTAVSLGVAAVPEGLPAVVTVALALGTHRMLKRGALIRRLPAVETLGAVTVICTDKTGTLTENVMTLTEADVANHHLLMSDLVMESSDQPEFDILKDHPLLALLIAGGALCNNARLEEDREQPGQYRSIGDPTEIALLKAAAKLDIRPGSLEEAFPRVDEAPFDSDRKRMTTVHRIDTTWLRASGALELALGSSETVRKATHIVFTKGAPDQLLEVSTRVWKHGSPEPISEEWRSRIDRAQDAMADRGMRLLGVSFRLLDSSPQRGSAQDLESDLIFIGLAGLTDPPRKEAKLSVDRCKTAGIRPIMITGDHPLTAKQIAGEVGILQSGRVVSGKELTSLSGEELESIADSESVYARVSPEQKLRLVEALQSRGHIVAMTGDGVNDAPALKRADAGVAMGISGTDVSKEAADLVLLDDNFATIVAAVEEGRVIYDNIRKFVRYLLATNSAEIWVMLAAPLLGMPLPLLPLQILWINLVTDGPPALALGFEVAEPNTMRRPPRPPGESILARGVGIHVIWVGLLMGTLSLGAGFAYWQQEISQWQTVLFTSLTFAQMAHVLAIRSETESTLRMGPLSNWRLTAAVAITLGLQLAVIYIEPLQRVFRTESLAPLDLAISLAVGALIFIAVEIEKWVARSREAEKPKVGAVVGSSS